MSLAINQLRDISTLFSRGEVLRWLKNDFESINLKISRYNIVKKNKELTYLEVLRKAYKIIEKDYPNEYILKNEFLNQWLKKELGDQNSIIYNELRIGKAIADLAMFNGISKVFEIKTILDKDSRLSFQLQEYKRIFNEVYIIVPKSQLAKYIEYDKSIGVISYNSNSKFFTLEKKSNRNNLIDVDLLMEVLHTKEYLKIAKDYYKELPEMNAFNQFKVCKELISMIPQEELNTSFLSVMKIRKINNHFFNKLNDEFNQICLSLNLSEVERDNLVLKLKSNIV